MNTEDWPEDIGTEPQDSSFHRTKREKIKKKFVTEYTFINTNRERETAFVPVESEKAPTEKEIKDKITLLANCSRNTIRIVKTREREMSEEELYNFDDPLD